MSDTTAPPPEPADFREVVSREPNWERMYGWAQERYAAVTDAVFKRLAAGDMQHRQWDEDPAVREQMRADADAWRAHLFGPTHPSTTSEEVGHSGASPSFVRCEECSHACTTSCHWDDVYGAEVRHAHSSTCPPPGGES